MRLHVYYGKEREPHPFHVKSDWNPPVQPFVALGTPGGGHLGIFWVGMCRTGLQIGTPFQIPLKLIPRARNLYPVLEFALKLIPRSRNGPFFYTPF